MKSIQKWAFSHVHEFSEPVSRFLFLLFGDVRINIHGDLDIGMAEPFLHFQDSCTGLKQ